MANPKSAILGTLLSTRMLAGLISLWMKPWSKISEVLVTFLVHLPESLADFGDDANGLVFFDFAFFLDEVVEVAGVTELCDDVGIVLGLEHIEEFHDVLAVECFEGVDFVLEELGVDGLLDHLHVDHLHGHQLLRVLVPALVHLAAEPSPDFLVQRVTVVVDCLPRLRVLVVVLLLLLLTHHDSVGSLHSVARVTPVEWLKHLFNYSNLISILTLTESI